MSPRLLKKVISGLIALSVILSVYVAKPVEASADTGMQLNRIYDVKEEDYYKVFDDRDCFLEYTAHESGYYLFESTINFDVLESSGEDWFNWATSSHPILLGMDSLIESHNNSSIEKRIYVFEEGRTYYIIKGGSDTEGKICLRKVND